MKGKILIATLLFVSLAFLSCDYNDPVTPYKGYAYCIQDGEAHCHVVGSTGTYWGSIKNVGESTAYNVRILLEWKKVEDDSVVKQKVVYINPADLEAGKSGTYHIEVHGLPNYSCNLWATIKWSVLP